MLSDYEKIELMADNTDLANDYFCCVSDLINHKSVQEMKQYIQHGKTTTFDHCLLVSFKSYCVCKKFKLDYRTAARGGLLHDLFLYDWHIKGNGRLHGFYHPGKALINAEKSFDLSLREKDIIKKHMWPLTIVPPKSREAFVVSFCDKTCATSETIMRIKLRTIIIYKSLFRKVFS